MAVSSCGMYCPFNVTAGQVSLFKAKLTWVDLFSLVFMRHCFNHVSNVALINKFSASFRFFARKFVIRTSEVCVQFD